MSQRSVVLDRVCRIDICCHLLVGFLFAGITVGDLLAVSANPHSYGALQPDGTTLILRLRGNEYVHWEEDANGFTVLRDRGWYVYAQRDEATGRLVSSGLRAGIDDPRSGGIERGLRPAKNDHALQHPQSTPGNDSSTSESSAPAGAPPSTGVVKNLVVLMRWSDHSTRTVPSESDIDVVMNNVGPHPTLAPTGSVRDVYLENSYGALSLDSTVAYWVTVNNTEAYYADGNSGLTTRIHGAITNALDAIDADPAFNFSDFDIDNDGKIDAIAFLHSGYGAEWGGIDCDGAHYSNRIWSHKWALSTNGWNGWTSSDGVNVREYHISPALWGTCGSDVGRIGVIAHETGHFFGLPDLYDTDSSDSGNGIGSYGLMANSWGFDGSQRYPPHMSPWSKKQLGWVTPTVINTAGTYNLSEVEFNASVYRIDLGYPSNEYLLIENRQPAGFDGDMPQGGLAIWHIDDNAGYNTQGDPSQSGWPANGNHYRVALLQADGAYDLERGNDRGDRWDVFHAGDVAEIGPSTSPTSGPFPNTDAYQGGNLVQTDNRIFNISSSGSSMSFSFEVVGLPQDPPAGPSNLLANTVSYDQIDLVWQDNAVTESGFKIERSTDGLSFAEIATVAADVTSFIDMGLSPNTSYWYRVFAYNSAGASTATNTASATTEPPPPPPAPPLTLLAAVVSDEAIDLAWTDDSIDEEGFKIRRSFDQVWWSEIATVAADSASYSDSGLDADTTYYYEVFSFSVWGESGSNQASATTDLPPSSVDAFTDQDIFASGTVSGTYQDTWEADGSEQIVTERVSGGVKSKRRSFCEHQWLVSDVRGGIGVTLFVNGWAPSNSENDDFLFEVSSDGGNTWTTVLTIENGTSPGTTTSGALANDTSGTVYVRVVDSDDTQGSNTLDSVYIDLIFIHTDLDPTDTPPNAPTNLTANALSATEVELSWLDTSNNEFGFEIWRSTDGVNFSSMGTTSIDATSYVDTSTSPNITYNYLVTSFTLSYEAVSNMATVTTPDGIDLSSSGSKQKGKLTVTLTWTGGASTSTVDVWRSLDGAPFEKIADGIANNDGGSFTDATDLKGTHTLAYQVCSPAVDLASAAICSNETSETF